MAVSLSFIARKTIVQHCKSVYPKEGCGILVGKRDGDQWFVHRAVPVPNRNEERSQDRFEISPKDYLRVEKEVTRDGLEIIGFFHSHPDVPPFPSPTDAQFAWEGFLNIIVGVFNGQRVFIRAHLYDGKTFIQLPVFVPVVGSWGLNLDGVHTLNLAGEVEPFVTIAVLEGLSGSEPEQLLLVRFDHGPALHTLTHSLSSTSHRLLGIRWNEEGFWEVLMRAGGTGESPGERKGKPSPSVSMVE